MFRAASRLQQHARPVARSVSAAASNATAGTAGRNFPSQVSSYFSVFALPHDHNQQGDRNVERRLQNNSAACGFSTSSARFNATTVTPFGSRLVQLGRRQQQHSVVLGSASFHNFPSSISGRRGFASQANDGGDELSSSSASVDDQLEKLFRENDIMKADATAEPWVDGSITASSGLDFIPTWYNPADQCLNLIMYVQQMSGMELSMSIVVTTFTVRCLLLPVVISGQRSASRMAHLQPELTLLKEQYERVQNPTTEQKAKLGNKVQDLFKRYDFKPARSMIAPFVQFPFFMGMFFGLKKMPDYFPDEMANGGMLWFPDLTLPDPNYILPAVCFFTFLATVEMGKEQMMASNPQNAPMMIMVFRGLSLMMIPICVNFHTGMLCYWTVSNLFTLFQIGLMKLPPIKKAFGIWDAPKPIPGMTGGAGGSNEGFMDQAKKSLEMLQGKPTTDIAKMKQHNERIESKKKVSELSRSSRERRRRSIKKRDG